MSDNTFQDFFWQQTEIQCPLCSYYVMISLRELHEERTIICRGCHSSLHLRNEGNGLQELEESLEELTSVLSRFG